MSWKNPFEPFLSRQTFMVLDGAMATELEALGADLNDALWSAKILIEEPDLIETVHTSYLLAGADILSTATYQATYAGFAQKGISKKESDYLFQESVRLAASARRIFWNEPAKREDRILPLIAASIGPYGAYLADGSEYHGNYGLSKEALQRWHQPQVEVLVAQKEVDFLLFETIPSLLEAEAIVALMSAFPDTPYCLSFSCRDSTHLSHGEAFVEAVALASASSQMVGVGINCTPPGFVEGLLRSVQGRSSKPLMVYPNSGEIWDARNHCWRMPKNLLSIPDQLTNWYQAGARIIGGCCRTSPDQIARIRKERSALIKPL
jgi:homocysteine S-methyltransferase